MIPFYVDARGYYDGRPYVLPHAPGEPAYGVDAGWYVGAPCAEPDGPYDTEAEAIEAARDSE